jgi:exodeoxyribonuclease VII small subunit
MSKPQTPSPASFESALEQLQGTVRKLESGELGLEQALQHFEEGVRLTRACQQHLTSAEQRVEILMKGESSDGKPELQPFSSTRTPIT